MTINTQPMALLDLFGHIVTGRTNAGEITALIEWLQEQRARLAGDDPPQPVEAEPVEVRRLQILLAWEAQELTWGQAAKRLEVTGLSKEEAKELWRNSITAGKNAPYVKPLKLAE